MGGKRQEISGAFGDAGMLFPLALSLIIINGVNPTSLFLGVGLFYIGAGVFFRLPMPVQPLKAVSSIAIALALSAEAISAAGILLGVVLLFLSWTGAITWVGRVVSVPVIKGIQLTLGLMLVKSGFDLMFRPQVAAGLPAVSYSIGPLVLPIGAFIAFCSLVFLLFFLKRPLLPASLTLICVGLLVGLFLGVRMDIGWTDIGPVPPIIGVPSLELLVTAFVLLVIPQLPLSLGNAILSTADVAREYYGEKAVRVTPKRLALSMGIANIAIGLIGGMPSCHGAGGLTAHHRFGARTPLANIIIGSTCLVLALVLGKAAISILSAIPFAVLGALLAYVGWRHFGLVIKLQRPADYIIVGIVASLSLLCNNLAIGAVGGIAFDWTGRYLGRQLAGRWPDIFAKLGRTEGEMASRWRASGLPREFGRISTNMRALWNAGTKAG